MTRYGLIHQVSDFMSQTVKKKQAPFMHQVADLLAKLDSLQNSNPLVTLGFQTGGAVRVLHNGREVLSLYPGIKRLRLYAHIQPLSVKLKAAAAKGSVKRIKIKTEKSDYTYWQIDGSFFDALIKALGQLSYKVQDQIVLGEHPRYFHGSIREAALQLFFDSGSICAGIDRKAHRLTEWDRIVFDHILPYSRGGANSASNIQVLCESCNLKKRATALGNAASK